MSTSRTGAMPTNTIRMAPRPPTARVNYVPRIHQTSGPAVELMIDRPVHATFADGARRAGRFKSMFGHGRIPGTFLSDDGFPLGYWVYRMRLRHSINELSPAKTELLEKLGVVFDRREAFWIDGLDQFQRHVTSGKKIPARDTDIVTVDGFPLGSWIAQVRSKEIPVTPERSREAEWMLAGLTCDQRMFSTRKIVARPDRLEEWIEHLRGYADVYARPPETDYVGPTGAKLGAWFARKVRADREGRLSAKVRRMIKSVGVEPVLQTVSERAAIDRYLDFLSGDALDGLIVDDDSFAGLAGDIKTGRVELLADQRERMNALGTFAPKHSTSKAVAA